jgi:sulfur carrier protein
MAKIQLNGKKIAIRPKATIYDLLKRFKLNNKKVAIEHNGIIIPEANYKKKYLKSNDKLEVVHFIGGG